MIKQLEEAGYDVTFVSGGPRTDEELAAANEEGVYYVGQDNIPKPFVAEDDETGAKIEIPPLVVPKPDGREQIVRVVGHGVDTTIYTHDEESVRDLLSHVDEPHPRYTPYVPGTATAG